MKAFTNEQQIYLSLMIVGVVFALAILVFLLYRIFFRGKNLKNSTYKMLYRYSDLNDYLLLNNYRIHIDTNNIGDINHVLISNKFIVVINVFPISGVITGSYMDEQLRLTDKKGTRLIANPLNYNRNLTKRVALFNNLDNSFIKGIVVINSDSVIKINDVPEQFFICKRSELKKVLRIIDSIDVKPFKEDTVVDFINHLNKENISSK